MWQATRSRLHTGTSACPRPYQPGGRAAPTHGAAACGPARSGQARAAKDPHVNHPCQNDFEVAPYRRFFLSNIIEKVVSQNDIYRKQFSRKLDIDADTKVLRLQPGNAYLFWGYRTYHATFPCAPDALRVTVILHYGNVHGKNWLLAAAQRFNGRLRRLLRKAG